MFSQNSRLRPGCLPLSGTRRRRASMAGSLIRGKVAQVLNDRQIIINRGRDQGVTPGMRFAVLDLSAADVRDPDTNEVLGSLFFEKARVEVARVEAKISLAQTYELVYE